MESGLSMPVLINMKLLNLVSYSKLCLNYSILKLKNKTW